MKLSPSLNFIGSIFHNYHPRERQVALGIGLWGTASTRGSGLAPPSGAQRDKQHSQPGRRGGGDHLVPQIQGEKQELTWGFNMIQMVMFREGY